MPGMIIQPSIAPRQKLKCSGQFFPLLKIKYWQIGSGIEFCHRGKAYKLALSLDFSLSSSQILGELASYRPKRANFDQK